MRGLAGLFIVRRIDREWARELERIINKGDERELEEITIAKARSYGVITRNFAKLLRSILSPYETLTNTDNQRWVFENVSLVAEDGTSFPTGVRAVGGSTGSGGYYYAVFNVVTCIAETISWTMGAFFKIGSGTTSPTPDDYTLESEVMTLTSLSFEEIDNPDNTILALTGSGTVESDFTAGEVGVFMRTQQYWNKSTTPPTTYNVLLDRATISPIDFVAGDPITVQYKLTLA